MAEYKNTPQFRQAVKVLNVLNMLYEQEKALRGIKCIEYNQYFKSCPDKNSFESIKIHFDSLMKANKYTNASISRLLDEYPKTNL